MKELLSVKEISKNFGPNRVLNRVSFTLNAGEVICLVGENGAGKSTLIKILSGAQCPTEGQIIINEKSYESLTPQESMNLGIHTIYQDIELIEFLTVADNIFLGKEVTHGSGIINEKKQFMEARALLDEHNINIDERLLVDELSVAQKQMLQIAKALYGQAKVLILDEPTSSLGKEETEALIDLVFDLRKKGYGIIYISHYLEEVFKIADKIIVLKDGVNVGIYNRSEVKENEIIEKMVGRSASMFYEREEIDVGSGKLEIQGFNRKGIIDDVSFSLREGEIFGIGGLVGSGKSELVNMIFGADKKDSGKVILRGKELHIRSPKDAIKNGIAFITEDRQKLGLFPDRSVLENTVIVNNEKNKVIFLNNKKDNSETGKIVNDLNISLFSHKQEIISLSGGNQQKVILGRWLLGTSEVYIFDEPTKGVDIGAKEEIYNAIVNLAKQGKFIILVSSDMPELLSLSDRIGVMRNGKMPVILQRGVTEEDLIKNFWEAS